MHPPPVSPLRWLQAALLTCRAPHALPQAHVKSTALVRRASRRWHPLAPRNSPLGLGPWQFSPSLGYVWATGAQQSPSSGWRRGSPYCEGGAVPGLSTQRQASHGSKQLRPQGPPRPLPLPTCPLPHIGHRAGLGMGRQAWGAGWSGVQRGAAGCRGGAAGCGLLRRLGLRGPGCLRCSFSSGTGTPMSSPPCG